MLSILSMQAEISLVVIMVLLLLADLMLKEPHHKTLQTLACVLMAVQIIINIVPSKQNSSAVCITAPKYHL